MRVTEHDPRLPAWLNRVLNAWPFCLETSSVRTLFAIAIDEDGVYCPGDRSLFYNGFVMVRLTAPFGIWLHVKPTVDRRLQFGLGWKLNGRAAISLRWQSDEEAAKGVLGPNLGQATGWQRGTA